MIAAHASGLAVTVTTGQSEFVLSPGNATVLRNQLTIAIQKAVTAQSAASQAARKGKLLHVQPKPHLPA